MRPIDAWHIISANMERLYKMRKTNCFKGYTEAETEAEVICFKALQEMEKRQDIEPQKKLVVPDKYKRLILGMADNSMKKEKAAAAAGYSGSGAVYALAKIQMLTGLDPCDFHDLNKLLAMVEEEKDD